MDINLPKFGFGGRKGSSKKKKKDKKKKDKDSSDSDSDSDDEHKHKKGDLKFGIDGDVSMPSAEGKVTTPEIDANLSSPDADVDGKGRGGLDFNIPKFGFGGHKGSKKEKKKDKKKKDKDSSDSDSDSDDEHKKGGMKFGIGAKLDHDGKVNVPNVDGNLDGNIGAG